MKTVLLVLSGLLFAAGCAPADIDATYGKRRGSPGAESVSGTAVLAGMFESAGHRVTTWRRLSPKLSEFDAIVWIPDSFAVPQTAHRTYLQDWLVKQPGRTLVYVGRDYDAETDYWNQVQPQVPATQAVEVARRAAVSKALHDQRRAESPALENCDWFTVQSTLPRRNVTSLSGPWSVGIDATKLRVVLDSRFQVPTANEIGQWQARELFSESDMPAFDRLLFSGEDPLVTRLSRNSWSGSQILVVTNGSFLLNLSLINHEHRKLAGRLVNACGLAGKVAFLESGSDGPQILDKEPGANAPTGFEVFTVWPIGAILLHLTALGMLACITLFPVFGRPRELPPPTTADFGQHVTALGELLELTADREYAVSRLRQYQEQLKHVTKIQRKARP